MVLLAGADGMLLHALGDPQFSQRAERVALRPGATWHEQHRGTNAVGTALLAGHAVVVHGDEHYLERNSFLTCAAAPIRNACGELLGALDVSGDHRGYYHHTLGLVRAATRMIEHRLFDTRYDMRQWAGLRLRLHTQPEGLGTVTEGLLAVGEDGQLAGANSIALHLLGLHWHDMAQTRLDSVLAESMAQLLDDCQHSMSRVVHTVGNQALWVRVEGTRKSPVALRAIPTATVPTAPTAVTTPTAPHAVIASVPATDALAALDTGDATLHAVLTRARRVMDKPIALLLLGESGVGKEVLARAVHRSSTRAGQAFVAVNCAALPENLIEAELFGYQSGAFTGARREGTLGRIREAHGGTLFLDEIGDMPLPLQARLLRVLQDRQVVPLGGGKPVAVDFALVCATHRDLVQEMQTGRFRQDLYYRLNGLALQLPALRVRTDLDYLLNSILQTLLPTNPPRPVRIAPDVMQQLRRYHWPGNLRQLSTVLRTACALLDSNEAEIGWAHLPDDLAHALRHTTKNTHPSPPTDLRTLSRQAIEAALLACGGNASEAARNLGISRNTLYRRMRR